MVDSHHVMVTTILLAVVIVGITGLYFTMSQPDGADIVYVGNMPTVSSPGIYKPLVESFAVPKDFVLNARGITGLSSQRNGTGLINMSTMYDLRMTKSSIDCLAQLYQDNDTATLYTCGDNASNGGTITCDIGDSAGGTGNSSSNPTNNTNCTTTQNNGAFVICNFGSYGAINKSITAFTIGGSAAAAVSMSYAVYNATDTNAACSSNCSKCMNTTTTDASCLATGTGQQDTVCQYFATGGGATGTCMCQCFGLRIANIVDIQNLKSGKALSFTIQDTIYDNGVNASTYCV